MMKRKALIPLLLMTPILFMGNSPAPYYADFYHDIPASQYQLSNLTYGAKETIGDLELYPFTLDIQNNSEYYLAYYHLDIFPTGDYYVEGVNAFKILSPYYDEDCIKPNDTLTVFGYAIDTYSLDQLNVRNGYGFSSNGVTASFENPILEDKFVSYNSSEYYKKTFRYDLRFDSITYEQQDGYSYALVIEYAINGHTHYYFTRDVGKYQSIYSFEDAEEIEIKSISAIGEKIQSFGYGGALEDILKSFGIVCLIFLGIIGVLGWVVSSIIVLVKQPWRRKDES